MGNFVEEWECELCGLKMKNVTPSSTQVQVSRARRRVESDRDFCGPSRPFSVTLRLPKATANIEQAVSYKNDWFNSV